MTQDQNNETTPETTAAQPDAVAPAVPAPQSDAPVDNPADVAGTSPGLNTTASEGTAVTGPRPDGGNRGGNRGGSSGGNRGSGGRSGGGDRNRGRGGRDERESDGIESSVIRIYRCAKVVKGGRTFSFAALVVVGDRAGKVGIGYGKANEVPSAVEKATKEARASMFTVPLKGTTIPHRIMGRTGASQVLLVPAHPGTGVTAGKTVRPMLELAGVTDILTKSFGSTSPKNLLKATVDALRQLQTREQVQTARKVTLTADAGELVSSEA